MRDRRIQNLHESRAHKPAQVGGCGDSRLRVWFTHVSGLARGARCLLLCWPNDQNPIGIGCSLVSSISWMFDASIFESNLMLASMALKR